MKRNKFVELFFSSIPYYNPSAVKEPRKFDQSLILRGAELLRAGDLVAFPTETVYGLGADALNSTAVSKIFAAKGRPPNNPLIVHVADTAQMKTLIDPHYASSLASVIDKLSHLWPGPLTIIVPKHNAIPEITTAGNTSVGLRIPDHPIALALLRSAQIPIAAPSANISNYISPTTADHVREAFSDMIPLILDGGPTTIGIESTVLSLITPDQPMILRPGAITAEQIASALEVPVTAISLIDDSAPKEKLLSPGLTKHHYSPKTPLMLLEEVDIWTLPMQRIGLIAFSEGLTLEYDFHAISVLSHNRNLEEVALKLFSALREMDTLNLDLILIDSCSEDGIGRAIMNRIKRAIHKRTV